MKRTHRRLATGAAVVVLAGVLLPFAGSSSASAAGPLDGLGGLGGLGGLLGGGTPTPEPSPSLSPPPPVTPVPTPSPTPSVTVAPRSPTISGEATRRSTFGTTVTVTGEANPGTQVVLYLYRRGSGAYSPDRVAVANSSGVWTTSYAAIDDFRYFARVAGVPDSRAILSQVSPIVGKLLTQRINGAPRIVVTGRAVPSTNVFVHYRLNTDPAGTFPRIAQTKGTSALTFSVPLPKVSSTAKNPLVYSVKSPAGRTPSDN